MRPEKIADVFKTVGQPTVTYVKRDSGKLEARLSASLDEGGQICLVTGPSKTGKTTLYREVLAARNEIPLIVQCDTNLTCDELWKKCLEEVDFSRVERRHHTHQKTLDAATEVGGDLGWKWLAKASAKLRLKVSGTATDDEIKQCVLSNPSPDLLIPILKATKYVLVIEDFHYLTDTQKVLLFQQWKRFVDNEVSVIILGTTHRAVDIANSNHDLIGRINQIDVGHWSLDDLMSICSKGMKYIGTSIPAGISSTIASESVGLPIIVQQVCLEIFREKNITVRDDSPKQLRIDNTFINKCFHNVASHKYAQFGSYYDTIISGPREKSRKYKTYELILACFTLDPIKFSLKRVELNSRMSNLGIPNSEIPPAASVNSTLGALKSFQERRNLRLLEWIADEEKLYIIEPSFLFYVRWRKPKAGAEIQLDLFEKLFSRILEAPIRDIKFYQQPS